MGGDLDVVFYADSSDPMVDGSGVSSPLRFVLNTEFEVVLEFSD